MKLNSPLPQPLSKECTKAAKIFKSFVDGGNNGLDGVIPRVVLENARGFAIFTIFKAGFVFSARAGSGVVIAKLNDGTWSAPSAIGTAGLGVGGQAGAEMTDFLVVLNSRAAIRSFMAAGSLTLGGNMSIALGPLGRNGEAIGSLNTSGKIAAMYSYSKTRGLFGGLSIEGSVIVERQDANVQAYHSPVTARLLLGGVVDPPEWALPLIQTLESCTGMPGYRKWVEDGTMNGSYAFGGVSSPEAEPNNPSYTRGKKKGDSQAFPPASWSHDNDTNSYIASDPDAAPRTRNKTWYQTPSTNFETQFESDFSPEPQPSRHPRFSQSVSYNRTSDAFDTQNPFASSQSLSSAQQDRSNHTRSMSMASTPNFNTKSHKYPNLSLSDSFSKTTSYEDIDSPVLGSGKRGRHSPPFLVPKPELRKPLTPREGVARAIALYDFQAVESGDLSFSKGDVIIITKKSNSSNDWWTGKVNNRQGIFPANFVEVV